MELIKTYKNKINYYESEVSRAVNEYKYSWTYSDSARLLNKMFIYIWYFLTLNDNTSFNLKISY